jgi:hypothetical protein
MDVVALGLHYEARTELYQEDPRSQNRDLGHPSDFLRVLTQTLKPVPTFPRPRNLRGADGAIANFKFDSRMRS